MKRSRKGFTLVEVIISIVLVSIILISMLTTLVKLKEIYSDVHENSDALVYSSSIARIINNDVMDNNGIRFITCDTYGTYCDIILGNDDRRKLVIERQTDEVYEPEREKDVELVRTNVITTLKYTDVTDGKNETVYIRTLESNIYTTNRCGGAGKDETTNRCKEDKQLLNRTSDGFNFYKMVSDQYQNNVNIPSSGDVLTDVVTNIKIYIYDGINESNLDYAASIYASGRYNDANKVGTRVRLELDDNGSEQRGTAAIDEIFGVGFFEPNTDDIVTSIDIPKKSNSREIFEGYYYKASPGSSPVAIVDSEGKVVIRNTYFIEDVLIDYADNNKARIYAVWAPCKGGYTYDDATGKCNQKTFNVKLDPTPTDSGASPVTQTGTTNVVAKYKVGLDPITIPERPGYKFLGYYNTDETKRYFDENGNSVGLWEETEWDDDNNKLVAKWQANNNTPYVVRHWRQKLDAADTPLNSTNFELGTGDTVTHRGVTDSKVDAPLAGKTGFANPTVKQINIDGDGNAIVEYYYLRNKYTFTLGKGTGISSVSGAGTYQYGKSVTINANVSSGYSFKEWKNDVNGNRVSQTPQMTIVVSGDVKYTAYTSTNTYDCAAGQYLPKGSTTCANCTKGNYCPGSPTGNPFTYNESSDQGIYQCPANYRDGTGATKESECTMSLASGNEVTTAGGNKSVCKIGYYRSGNVQLPYGETKPCYSCGSGKYTSATGQSSCKSCEIGSYNNTQGQSACTACQPTANTNGTAGTTSAVGGTSCNASCNIANVATWLTASWSNGTVTNNCKVNTCKSGYYKNGNACPACSTKWPNCTACTPTACTACASGYALSNGSCVQGTYTITYNYNSGTAPANAAGKPSSYTYGTGATINGTSYPPTRSGYAFNGWSENSSLTGAAFTKTIPATATGNKTFYAKWCQNGQNVTNGKSTVNASTAGTCAYTATCNSGYYCSASCTTITPTCSACPTGCSTCTSGSVCTSCKAGYYKNGNSCTACATGTYQPSNNSTATACTACQANSYNNATGQTKCIACQPTNNTNGTNGKTNGTGQTSCTVSCNIANVATWTTASWSNGTVTNNCTVGTCKAGYYKNGNACTACPAGCSTCSSGTVCTSCKAGYYKNGNSCTQCQAGKYQPSNNSKATSCTNCQANSYNNATGQSTCKACQPTNNTNGTAGKTNGAGQTSCATSCNIANVATWTTASWSNGTVSNNCTVNTCKAGYYKNGNACSACPAGCSTCSSGSVCTSCKAGYYKNGNSCTACAKGKYQPSNNSTATSCTNCQANSYNNAVGQTTCKACQPTNNTNGTAGKTNGAGQTSCATSCNIANVATWATASWSNGTVSNNCTVNTCKAGYYKNGNACSACPAGCSTCSSGSVCTSCKAGYYKNGNSCTACAKGKYQPSNNSKATSCTNCQANSYNNATGQSTCKACQPTNNTNGTAGKTNGAGQTSCATSCNIANVATWATASWSNGTVTNNCTVSTCKSGYYKNGNACPACSSKWANCTACTASACTACASGYTLSGGSCVKQQPAESPKAECYKSTYYSNIWYYVTQDSCTQFTGGPQSTPQGYGLWTGPAYTDSRCTIRADRKYDMIVGLNVSYCPDNCWKSGSACNCHYQNGVEAGASINKTLYIHACNKYFPSMCEDTAPGWDCLNTYYCVLSSKLNELTQLCPAQGLTCSWYCS